MNRLIYKGLVIETPCKYFHIHPGNNRSLIQHKDRDLYELTYIPGDTSYQLSSLLGIPTIGGEITLDEKGMGYPKRFIKTTLTLNGLCFDKLTYDPHVIRIVIVGDNDSRVVQDYERTTIVVNKNDYKDKEFIYFLLFSGNLHYISPSKGGPKLEDTSFILRNFPRISLKDKSLNLVSDSETVYFLRKSYDQYLIRSIDYQDQFITEIAKILDEYGIELARVNREKTLTKSSYISYQFSQTPVKYNHPHYSDPESNILYHKLPVDFTFRCADMVMYYDFKNKYNNVDFLTNFCEFKTTDKYGGRWSAAIKWGQITEDFNQMYSGDDNSNFSFQCQFRCELYFYEVYDKSIGFLKEVKYELESIDMNNEITNISINGTVK
jgi:hypothetical protein